MKRRGSPRSLTSAPFSVSLLGSDETFVVRTISDTLEGIVAKSPVETAGAGRIRRLRAALLLLSSRRAALLASV